MIRIKRSELVFGLVLLLSVGLITVPMIGREKALAQDNRIVNIHVDDITKSFSTDAHTVRDALERANVDVSEYDLVEPALDTEINIDLFNINVYRAKPVTVIDKDKSVKILSPFQSPELIAKQAGFVVYPEDSYELRIIDDFVSSRALGLEVRILRSTPITLDYYGSSAQIRTRAKDVSELLGERGIDADSADVIRPELTAPITEGMTVHLIKTEKNQIVEEEPVNFSVREVLDDNLAVGQRVIQVKGEKGAQLSTYRVLYENDKEISRELVESVVIRKPVEQVVLVGTRVLDPSDSIQIGQSLAAQRGWTGSEWQCLYQLWMKESNWNYLATNPSSYAYGIPQALPGSKMASAGSDWQTNPATQIKWGLSYISSRYGTPCGAWNFFQANNWY